MNNIDIREVKDLFQKLLDILERFGDNTINNEKKILQNILYIIKYEKENEKKLPKFKENILNCILHEVDYPNFLFGVRILRKENLLMSH